MDKKIKWCMDKEGIVLGAANKNLSEKYIAEANDTLDQFLKTEGKWKVVMGYYACYHALTSILYKVGVICKIHDCAIECMRYLGFDDEDIEFMIELKEKRISSQYYLKDIEVDEVEIKDLIFKCKELLQDVNIDDVQERINNGKK